MFGPNCQHPLTSFNHTHTHTFLDNCPEVSFLIPSDEQKSSSSARQSKTFSFYQRPAHCTSLGCWRGSRFTLYKNLQSFKSWKLHPWTTIYIIGILVSYRFRNYLLHFLIFRRVKLLFSWVELLFFGTRTGFSAAVWNISTKYIHTNDKDPINQIFKQNYVKDVKFDFKDSSSHISVPRKRPEYFKYLLIRKKHPTHMILDVTPIYTWHRQPICFVQTQSYNRLEHERSSTWKKKKVTRVVINKTAHDENAS